MRHVCDPRISNPGSEVARTWIVSVLTLAIVTGALVIQPLLNWHWWQGDPVFAALLSVALVTSSHAKERSPVRFPTWRPSSSEGEQSMRARISGHSGACCSRWSPGARPSKDRRRASLIAVILERDPPPPSGRLLGPQRLTCHWHPAGVEDAWRSHGACDRRPARAGAVGAWSTPAWISEVPPRRQAVSLCQLGARRRSA